MFAHKMIKSNLFNNKISAKQLGRNNRKKSTKNVKRASTKKAKQEKKIKLPKNNIEARQMFGTLDNFRKLDINQRIKLLERMRPVIQKLAEQTGSIYMQPGMAGYVKNFTQTKSWEKFTKLRNTDFKNLSAEQLENVYAQTYMNLLEGKSIYLENAFKLQSKQQKELSLIEQAYDKTDKSMSFKSFVSHYYSMKRTWFAMGVKLRLESDSPEMQMFDDLYSEGIIQDENSLQVAIYNLANDIQAEIEEGETLSIKADLIRKENKKKERMSKGGYSVLLEALQAKEEGTFETESKSANIENIPLSKDEQLMREAKAVGLSDKDVNSIINTAQLEEVEWQEKLRNIVTKIKNKNTQDKLNTIANDITYEGDDKPIFNTHVETDEDGEEVLGDIF